MRIRRAVIQLVVLDAAVRTSAPPRMADVTLTRSAEHFIRSVLNLITGHKEHPTKDRILSLARRAQVSRRNGNALRTFCASPIIN